MKTNNQESGKSYNSPTDRKKKTEKADLENKKAIFFEIGLILSLALVLFAFEWKSYENFTSFVSTGVGKEVIEDIIPITSVKPPEPKIIKPTTIFKEVDNKTEGVKDILVNTEIIDNEPYEPYIPLEPKKEIEVDEETKFIIVEEMPDFVGGEEARINFLRNNLTYPQLAREANIQGTVHLSFVIEKNGQITDVRILRGIGGGCDEEAVRVVKAMPNWKPGKQRDKTVRVQLNLPIKFMLSN
jgi:protein TonB